MTHKPRRVVLLDLDGTLTASHPGILASVIKTFEELGRPVPDKVELQRFIGPSVKESLMRNAVPEAEAERGVHIYRHYYADVATFPDPAHPGNLVPGKYYSSVFPGIIRQLDLMRCRGFTLAVATCKPEYQAIPVCKHFGLEDYLDGVYGASTDPSRISKDRVIDYACKQMGLAFNLGDRAVMVGDRWTDVDGATKTGLDCLGCAWGYAEPHELEDHGACLIIPEVDQLADAVSHYFE